MRPRIHLMLILCAIMSLGTSAHQDEPSVTAFDTAKRAIDRLDNRLRNTVINTGEFQTYVEQRDAIRSLIRSPHVHDPWLLVWGKRQSFNGTLIRARVYAFDGHRFRTVWSPGNYLDAVIDIGSDRFSVTHLLKTSIPWQSVRDDYLVTTDGPALIARTELHK